MNVSKTVFNTRNACGAFLFLMGLVTPVSNTFALSLETPPELLTHKADLIILGRVISTKAEEITYVGEYTSSTNVWVETSETVFTKFEVELKKTFKRSINESLVTILNSGGVTPDGRGFISQSTFDLEQGECIVAFLFYDERNKWWGFYAGSRGVFRMGKCTDDDFDSDVFDPLVTRPYKGHYVPRYDLPDHYRNSDVGLRLQELLTIIKKESDQ